MLEQFNILDWIMLVICAFFVVKAIKQGILRELGSLVGLVLAIWGGFAFYQTLADFLRRVVGKQDFWWETLAFIICFIGIYLLIISIANRISKVLYATSMSIISRLLGGVVGLVKGVIFCFIILNLLLMMQPISKPLASDHILQEKLINNSYLAPLVVKGGHYVLSFIPQDVNAHVQQSIDFLKQRADNIGTALEE